MVPTPDLNTFSKEDVQAAINELCKRLNWPLDRNLLLEYQNGLHPTLLSYEKVETPSVSLPAITKYMIGAQTYCDQLTHFYDIFRSCRHVILLRMLNRAIKICDQRVKGIDGRISRLLSERDYDRFDAVLFEILTAAKYAELERTEQISFIEEINEKSPDLMMSIRESLVPLYVECKKFDRNADIFEGIRNTVRQITLPTILWFRKEGISAVIDLEFYSDPNIIAPLTIEKQCRKSLRRNIYIRNGTIGTKVRVLSNRTLDDYLLFPSPKYFSERYDFRPQDRWHGLTHSINAQHADLVDERYNGKQGVSTWLNEVEWECAIRWQIRNDELLWKTRKLNYTRIFNGLKQLESRGSFSALHLWFEREGRGSIRKAELLDFVDRLSRSRKDSFSWMIFNETVLETSPNGVFDIIEHAHRVTGLSAPQKEPLISNIFVKEESQEVLGEFGIGRELPDIDEEFRKRGLL